MSFSLFGAISNDIAMDLGTANTLIYVIVSKRARPRLIDRVQARAFVDRLSPDWREVSTVPSGASVSDLKTLVSRFVGDAGAERAFASFASVFWPSPVVSTSAATCCARS